MLDRQAPLHAVERRVRAGRPRRPAPRPRPPSSRPWRSAGPPSAVVTAAGIDACGKLDDVAVDAWVRVVQVNLVGTAAVVRAALPHLRPPTGASSPSRRRSASRPSATRPPTAPRKFGVVGFTRALAAETAGEVGVTLLIPGGMHTHFFDDRTEQYKPGRTRCSTTRRDVAAAILFALSQPARLRAPRARRRRLHGDLLAVTGPSAAAIGPTGTGASLARPPVLVLRALGLGDTLTGVPALRGLRRAFPGRRLLLAAAGEPAELLRACGWWTPSCPPAGSTARPRARVSDRTSR